MAIVTHTRALINLLYSAIRKAAYGSGTDIYIKKLIG